MEEQERLTMEFVKSLMDKSYTLVWVDYNDNLDNCRDTIQKCLEERSCESLWEKKHRFLRWVIYHFQL